MPCQMPCAPQPPRGCQLGARWCLASSIKNSTLLVAAYHASPARRGVLARRAGSRSTQLIQVFGRSMADCRLVPVLLHHTLAASTADGRAPPCLSPAALIAVTARCCECVRPPQEPTATTSTSVVTETGGVTVLPDWGGTKVLPDYMDVRGILDIFAKARALHLCGPPAEWQAGADASAGAGAEVSLVLFPLLEVLELEDCAISRLTALPRSLRHLQATDEPQPEPEPKPEPEPEPYP